MLNNPLKYSDPSGENPLVVAAIVGAVFGAYTGGVIANGGEYNPFDWNWNSKTLGYMLGGAIVGAISGYLGATVATSGGIMSNTMGIATASYINSIGTNIYTGGQTSVSVSFGVASFNLSTGEWGYLWKKGNKWYENLGYFLGAMANLRDINNLINKTEAVLYTEKNDLLSHSSIVEKKTGKTLMSFGPNDNKAGGLFKYSVGFRRSTSNYHVYTDLPLDLTVNKYVFSLTRTLGKILPFQGLTTNCVNMSSLSLWLNGIPNLGIHPYLLYTTTWAYTHGIRADLFSYYLVNQ